MLKILTLVGARPQFIKAAAISRAIKNSFSDKIEEVIVHSGQHYDANMSSVFFEELGLPVPNHIFKLQAQGHSGQTAEILNQLEKVLLNEKPNAFLVYGDTNTTLAGALAASKNHIPLIHVEAGLRSFNKTMPEEINRILTDHCSSLLFCPTKTAVHNLKVEGIDHSAEKCSANTPKVYSCGDIMYDNSLYFSKYVKADVLNKNSLENYLLFTMHRPSNTDEPHRLKSICRMLMCLADKHQKTIAFPVHPRTKKALLTHLNVKELDAFMHHRFVRVMEPVSFTDMIALEKNCEMVITDSGGVQKEAYFFEKPCLILRSETEWVEIVEQGVAAIVDVSEDKLNRSYDLLRSKSLTFPKLFGDGRSAEFICKKIVEEIQ
ncbi:MAG: UDP-N-acetylglucosamine 2-epimerase (non-hydrolyzing) [Flavobacteriales bacterium]|nr:UDP-N-acetylglucosamine 2-epimerase (non-hydrolyzing) [Flavobacteriales bacterium]